MWLSKQTAGHADASAPPLRGTVTLSGQDAAVYTDAERRGLKVCAPGGYFWRPSVKDEVLVIKGGGQGHVIAALPEAPPPLEPGELLLQTGDASLRLSPDGHVAIKGAKVTFNDVLIIGEDEDDDEEDA